MAYTLSISLALGSSQTGLILSAQLKDTMGADVGGAVTTGFVELTAGNYLWTYAAFPDLFRGAVVFSAGGVVKAAVAVNPEEAENTDIKVSTRGDATAANQGTLASAISALGSPAQVADLPPAPDNAGIAAIAGTVAANLDAAVSSRLATVGYTAPPSAATIAAAVWNALTAALTTAGSIGKWLLDEVAAIKVKTDSIAVGVVNVVAPVASSGLVTIVRGDDYAAADGRALTWTDAGGTWPNLTGATVRFRVSGLSVTGTVVQPTGPGIVRVELTAAQTAAQTPRARAPYDLEATLSSTRVVTLVRGHLTVLADVPTAGA